MKTFLPLCAAALLLAVSLPLSAAPDADRGAVLRDEMEARFQLLEDKLSLQQERRLDELKNELRQLQDERKTWLDDTQNPIIATAEKKKEEVRATGERYVSLAGAIFTAMGLIATLLTLIPIFFNFRFTQEAKQQLEEVKTYIHKMKEEGDATLEEYENTAKRLIERIIKYKKKSKKEANKITPYNILSSDMIKQILTQTATKREDGTGDFIVKNSYTEQNIPVKFKKSNLNTLWELVASAQEQQNWEKACHYIGDILEEAPQDETARFALARCQVQMGTNPAISKEQRKILWEQAENYYLSRLPQTTGLDITSFANLRISYALLKEEKAKYAPSKEESSKLLAEAYSLLYEVYILIPENINILLLLASCRYKQATYTSESEKERFLQERKGLLEKALQLSPENIPVLQLLSTIYRMENQVAGSMKDRRELSNKTLELLNRARKLNPHDVKTLKLLAIATEDMTIYCDNEKEKERLQNNYINILKEAKQIAPKDIDVLGLIFLYMAKHINPSNNKSIYMSEFDDYFNKILELSPQNILQVNNIVVVLCGKAQKSDRVKRDFLFQRAEILLSALEKTAPFDSTMLKSFAALRIEQAREVEAQRREVLLQQAEGYLDRILPSEQKITLFNRACIAALRGQHEKVLELLEECRQAGTLPSREHIESDKDMDSLRDLEAFKEFVKRAYPAEDTRETDSPAGDSE